MKHMLNLVPFALLILTLIFGCSQEAIHAIPIEKGIDICTVCNMEVVDGPFATEVILNNDRVFKFDDIGCMYKWLGEQASKDVKATFVRDYHSSEWIPFERAAFVFDPAFHTPMGYGIYSFKDEETAKKWMEKEGKGKALTPSDLHQHEWVQHRNSMKGLKQKSMNQPSTTK